MGARAMWKATLDLGSIRVPVKLYAAAQDRGIHFRLLHARDRTPVRQQMIDPESQREIPNDQIRWGLELEEGRIVLLRADELDAANPKPSRDIEVLRFVPRAAVDPAWYKRPYFLGPDGSAPDCAALVDALRSSDRYGIARWVMRGDHHFGALGWREGQLQLVSLHAEAEVVGLEGFRRPEATGVSAQERKLAEQLVSMLDGPFDPGAIRDEYAERVQKLIAAKRRGRRFRVKEPLPHKSRGDLGRMLERSVRALEGKPGAAA
jgi:DNA end-binding protein Ku